MSRNFYYLWNWKQEEGQESRFLNLGMLRSEALTVIYVGGDRVSLILGIVISIFHSYLSKLKSYIWFYS